MRLSTGLLAVVVATAQAVDIVVSSSGGNDTTRMPYGLMHEDINNSGDGGIYAELISNRAFQGSSRNASNLTGWSPIDGTTLSLKALATPLSSALPISMNVAVSNSTSKIVGFANSGYWGIDVKQQLYKGSFYVKGSYNGSFTASLQSAITNQTFGSVQVASKASPSEWIQHNFTLTPSVDAPSSNNTFAITFDATGVSGGSLDFNLISLFPPTYKGRENGLRIDLAEAFEKLQPKFLRFPGGNALEGWKGYPWLWNETIGPLKNRPGRPGAWGYETSDGLGLVEYLHWCDDMGMEPILAVYSGLALDGYYVNESDFQWVIDSALDELEFIVGDANTTWGAVRESLGYSAWKINYVEVGNEDWLTGGTPGFLAYQEYRYPLLSQAIWNKYPDMHIINSGSFYETPSIPAPAIGDYHPYREPDNFYNEFHKLDNLTAENLTIVGEFASVHVNNGSDWDGDLYIFPWWLGAVGEAIFMIGNERNGDRVLGASYAPSLRNMNRWQWSICMIEFEADTSKTTLSTSWHVQYLISTHVITHTYPTTPSSNTSSLFFVAGSRSDYAGQADSPLVFKAANYNTTNHEDTPVSVSFPGASGTGNATTGTLTLLTSKYGPWAYNNPYNGSNVVIETTTQLTASANGTFSWVMPEWSVAVLDLASAS